MSPPVPGRALRIKDTLFFALPPEHRQAFGRDVGFDNYQRAQLFALIVALVNGLFGVVPDQVWRAQGWWAREPAYVWWATLHGALVVFGAGLWILLRIGRPASPDAMQPRHTALTLVFLGGTMLGMVALALVHQGITGGVTVLLLALGVGGGCFFLTQTQSIVLLGAPVVLFLVALPQVTANRAIWVSHAIVTADFALCAWLASRLLYSLRARDFLHLQTIEAQARALSAANARLREAHALKTELIAIAAHDLRDPLNAICGLAQELGDELPPAAPARTLVRGIGDSARRMSRLVDNLLTDSESDSGGIVLRRERVELAALTAAIVEDHRWLAGTKQLTLQFRNAAGGPVERELDPLRLRQVLENLLNNAIKFSQPGGHIEVTLAPDDAGAARLSVRDQGPGLTPDDRARIFTRFQRLSARPTRGEKTAGLGLAIVKNLVELHGGRVWAESEGPGRGTTFVVVLP